MRVLLQVPYPDIGVATPPPEREAGRRHRRTAVGPVLARQRDTQRKVCALSSWHGEHGTDPLALLVHEAMRRQAGAARVDEHGRELG